MMKVSSLTVQNFMPYKGRQTIHFPTDVSRNVLVVYGDNMRGKTSLLNAIRWAFYGRAIGRNLRAISHLDLVNVDAAREGDWTLRVEIEFDSGDHSYDLRREMTPRPGFAVPKSESELSVHLALRKDGTPLDAEEIGDEINQIMPADISRFFLFDGELLQDYEVLLLEDSGQRLRIKAAIEKVLGVPALLNGRDEIRTLLKQAQTAQARDIRQIQSLRAQAEQLIKLQEDLEELQGVLGELLEKEKLTNEEISSLTEALERVEGLESVKAKLDVLRTERTALETREAERVGRKRSLLREAWKDLLQPRLQQRLRDLQGRQYGYQRQIEQRAVLAFRLADLEKAMQEQVCPTCGQTLSIEQRTKLGAEVGRLEGTLHAMRLEIDKLGAVSGEINQLRKIRASGIGAEILAIEAELQHIAVRMTQVESEIRDLQKQIEAYDSADTARKRAKREQLLTHLGSLSTEITDTQVKIDLSMEKRNQTARLLSRNPEARHQRTSRIVASYTALDQIFSESIDIFRDELRQQVNKLASAAFARLTTESTFRGLEINQDYGLTIVDPDGRTVRERSAGAEQIIALALIDGLNKTARRSGPVVMDTPFGRLDPRHRENVLKYLPQMAEQVVILVHEGEFNKTSDIGLIVDHIGAVYEIERINARQSQLRLLRRDGHTQ